MAGIRRKVSTVPRRIYLTEELAGRVDLFLADPIRKKPMYAGLSVLVEELLKQYLDDVTKGVKS